LYATLDKICKICYDHSFLKLQFFRRNKRKSSFQHEERFKMIKLMIGATAIMLSLILYRVKPTEAAYASPTTAIPSSATSTTPPAPVVTPVLARTETDDSFTRLVKNAQKQRANSTRVLLIGDSLVAGLKNPLQQFFRQQGAQTEVLAQDGKRIASFTSKKGDMRDAFREALAKHPDIVLICLGTNDSYGNVASMPGIIRSVQIMNHAIRKTGARLYWIGPPTLGRYCGKRKDGTTFCHDPHAPVTPLLKQVYREQFFDSRMLEMKRWDGLHPTSSEFDRWSHEISRWISPAI
jgi:hypothetical protein